MDIALNTIATFFFVNSTPQVVITIFATVGWLVFVWLLLFVGIYFLEYEYKQEKHKADWDWVLLAIDIPALNLQTPRAVEQLFAHLAGAQSTPNYAERFRHGYKQRWFSFEIISIEGYIQFLVRTEVTLRDLVEAAIYAQYPEAEIVEVEDYTNDVPKEYPNETHDLWAADFGLAEDDSYPIRTYEEFEHNISKDTVLKDPMGTFLESFSRIGPGEQMWFQILIMPIDNSWKEKAIKKVKELIGDKSNSSRGFFGNITESLLAKEIGAGLGEINSQISGGGEFEASAGKPEKDAEPNKIRYLTPGQSKLVEGIEKKISKIGFATKMRGVYLARKEVFQPDRGVHALVGAINQYNVPSANSIVPRYTTKTAYFFHERLKKYRKNLLLKAYIKRKMAPGGRAFVFNIEELSTVWHFPMSHVQTPLLQKSQGKRAEPPASLPIEGIGLFGALSDEEQSITRSKSDTFSTDAGDVAYHGQKFG
jgi:hypothetical protein